MILLSTKKAKADSLKSMLETPPAPQKKNWENGLIHHFLARLTEWNQAPLTGTVEQNRQAANLFINNSLFHQFVLKGRCPFPQDFADALEWALMAGDDVPENKRQMTNFMFIYKNFEKIMKKEPCLIKKKKKE